MRADETEARLRRAFAGTSEQPPRALVDLELPALASKLLTPILGLLKPAAVLVAVIRRTEGHTVLLTRRAETLRSHKGQVSFPGGRRDDADASLADCALREAEEEVGLPPARAEVIGYLDDYPTITRYRVTPVIALVDPVAAYRTDPGEVAEVFEVPLAFVLSREAYVRSSLTRDGIQVPFFELRHEGHRIWGATAGMLYSLMRRVEQAV